uniref:Uncharacterized protein n=1 Tax=Chlamydomonas euryale TaxID=1486919 RepID=A0A7R9VNQ4_9CHLO|eukprot:366258-Chlamydomonas_euryale.AAC.3
MAPDAVCVFDGVLWRVAICDGTTHHHAVMVFCGEHPVTCVVGLLLGSLGQQRNKLLVAARCQAVCRLLHSCWEIESAAPTAFAAICSMRRPTCGVPHTLVGAGMR